MTTENKRRFTVISNTEFEEHKVQNKAEKGKSYQTNPLTEKLVKYVNEDKDKKFSVTDLLKW